MLDLRIKVESAHITGLNVYGWSVTLIIMKKLFILGNGNGWCSVSLRKMTQQENVYFINDVLPLVRFKRLAKIHYSHKLNHYCDIPFKRIWFHRVSEYIQGNIERNDEVVLLVYDWNYFGSTKQFASYLRKQIRNIKIVYIFTNIVKGSFAYTRNFVEKLNSWYDVVFAFDIEDAKKHGFSYSPLIYDADPNYCRDSEESSENVVFYVGQAKDRLEGLLDAYCKIKSLGINCDFHIANVDDASKKYENEIVYNNIMTYSEAVDRIKKSTCLIDIIQGESTGLTIKTCEAVCYDKKLITSNKHVVEYPFYDSRYIRVIESPDDIDLAFFEVNKDVHYSEEGKRYFSADMFLERLNKELMENESDKRQ